MPVTTRAMTAPTSKPYQSPVRAWASRRLFAARSRAASTIWISLMALRYHALSAPLPPALNNRHGNPEKVPAIQVYCLSYSPLPTLFSTVNPAFFASEIELLLEALNVDHTLRTGFLHAGQFVRCGVDKGRPSLNRPPHTLQARSQRWYS